MLPDRFTSARARAAAIAVAFSVVAGGVAFAAAPSFAAPATVDETGASASTTISDVTTETRVIPVEAQGFTPGSVVYVQLVDPNGDANWSWKTDSVTVGEDGAVAKDLDVAGALVAGTYSVTVFESDEVKASFDVEVAEATPEPTATETETGTPEPTATETETGTPEPTATETETGTPEPTATETETDTPEPTATETETEEPVEPAPTGTTDPTVEPSEPGPGVDVGPPTAWADSTNYSATEAAANGVGYQLSGFTPGVEVELVLTLPDGTVAEFSSLEPIIPAADGTYAGVITNSGAWPTGAYSVKVQTKDGQTIPVDVIAPPSDEPAPADTTGADDSAGDTGSTGDSGSTDGTEGTSKEAREVTPGAPAPVQSAEFGFTIDAAQSGGGSNGGSNTGTDTKGTKSDKGSLAQTGADDVFGVAGLGLLVALAGAGVVVGARFLGRRRDV